MSSDTPSDKSPETSKKSQMGSQATPGLKDFKKPADAGKAGAKPGAKPASKAAPKPAKVKPPRKPKPARSGVGLPAVLLLSVLAAGAGAAGGWMLPKIFDPANAAPAQAITTNTQMLKSAQTDIDNIKGTTNRLRKDLGGVAEVIQSRSSQGADIETLQNTVREIQAIDNAAELAAVTDPMTARIDALETLITPEGEDTGVASQLLARIKALETRLAELQATPPVSTEPIVLSYSTPAKTEADAASANMAEPTKTYDLVANFPRQAMLSALAVQSQNQDEPSWLRKIIGKHIQTDDLSAADARETVLKAENLVSKGAITEAIALIETLNPTLRAAAHQWMIEAKKTVK